MNGHKIIRIVTIGSSPQCNIVINGEGIVPVHCQITQDDNENYGVIAFGNNTFVNDKEIIGKISINQNDSLNIGKYLVDWGSFFNAFCKGCKKDVCDYLVWDDYKIICEFDFCY